MREMLKKRSVFGKKLVEHRLTIVLVSSPQNMMVSARNNLDRIQLNKTQLADDRHDIQLASGRACQTLLSKPKPTRVAVIDFKWRQFASLYKTNEEQSTIWETESSLLSLECSAVN